MSDIEKIRQVLDKWLNEKGAAVLAARTRELLEYVLKESPYKVKYKHGVDVWFAEVEE